MQDKKGISSSVSVKVTNRDSGDPCAKHPAENLPLDRRTVVVLMLYSSHARHLHNRHRIAILVSSSILNYFIIIFSIFFSFKNTHNSF